MKIRDVLISISVLSVLVYGFGFWIPEWNVSNIAIVLGCAFLALLTGFVLDILRIILIALGVLLVSILSIFEKRKDTNQ